jgi:pyrroline-5-carboxylate reductase
MAIGNARTFGKFSGQLVLLGAGKMGGAMLDGWLARGLNPKKLVVIEPQPAKAVKALARRGLKLNPKGKAAEAATIVIAVKPQTAPEAMPPLRQHVGKATLVLSIMAGRTLRFLETSLPAGTAIVRAMPNTPAAIGRGISVAVANARVSARQRKLAGDLLAAIGKVEWVGDETLMDAVTALSGSGPAYVFLLAEAMTTAGIAAGLPAELAARLARETVAGSG